MEVEKIVDAVEVMKRSPDPFTDPKDADKAYEQLGAVRTAFKVIELKFTLEDLELVESVWSGCTMALIPIDMDDRLKRAREKCVRFAHDECNDLELKTFGLVTFQTIAVRVFLQCMRAVFEENGKTLDTEAIASRMYLSAISNELERFIVRQKIAIAMFHYTKLMNGRLLQAMRVNQGHFGTSKFGKKVMQSLEDQSSVAGSEIEQIVPGSEIFSNVNPSFVSWIVGLPQADPRFRDILFTIQSDVPSHQTAQNVMRQFAEFAVTSLRDSFGTNAPAMFSEISTHYMTCMSIVVTNYMNKLEKGSLSAASKFGRKRSAKKGRSVRTGRR